MHIMNRCQQKCIRWTNQIRMFNFGSKSTIKYPFMITKIDARVAQNEVFSKQVNT